MDPLQEPRFLRFSQQSLLEFEDGQMVMLEVSREDPDNTLRFSNISTSYLQTSSPSLLSILLEMTTASCNKYSILCLHSNHIFQLLTEWEVMTNKFKSLRKNAGPVREYGTPLVLASSHTLQKHKGLGIGMQPPQKGIADDLDPRCVALFKRLREEAFFLLASAKAKLEGHMKKGKWG